MIRLKIRRLVRSFQTHRLGREDVRLLPVIEPDEFGGLGRLSNRLTSHADSRHG